MRICLGGRASYALLQRRAGALAALGHDVHLVSLEAGPPADGVTPHTVRAPLGLPGPLRYAAAAPAFAARVRALAPDVLDLHGVNTYGLYTLVRTGAPTVATVYGPDVYLSTARSALLRVAVRAAVRAADLVYASTPAARDHIREVLGLDLGDRLVVRSWGIPLDEITADASARRAEVRAAMGVAPEVPVLLHSRRLLPFWRPGLVVDALAALADRHPSAEAWFVYPEPTPVEAALRDEIEAEAVRRGVADRVRFLGPRPYDAYLSLCHAADVFVCVGESDLLASTLLEAMATGLVPVLADLPAYREVITDGANGVLLPAPTAAALAHALDTVLADLPATRARFAAVSAPLLREGYAEQACTQWLVDRYADLTASTSR